MQKHSFFYQFCKVRPLSLALAIAGIGSSVSAQEFSQTVFFGDSLTDTGRLQNIIKNSIAAPFLPTPQPSFTTNPDPTWAGVLANSYGHKATPNDGKTLTGTNYAVGGARTKEDVARVDPKSGLTLFTIPSTRAQMDNYLKLTNNRADPHALYAVWTGANDLFEAANATNPAQALGVITTAASHQATLVKQLGQAGANYILVPNIPDVGITPSYVGDPAKSATATAAAKLYNQTLYKSLSSQGVNVIPANTFALLQEAVGNKAGFGFENVTNPACPKATSGISSLACTQSDWASPNANETHAFADGIHPSGRTHRILAQYYRSIIDSPAQIGRLPQQLTQSGKANHQQLTRRLNNLQNHQQSLWIDGNISNHQLDKHNKIDNPNIMLGLNIANNHHTGAYLNYQKQDYRLSSAINSDVKQIGIGLYHRHDFERLRVSANVGLDRLDVHTDRHIAWDGEKRSHQARATGKRLHAALQGSYGFSQGNATYRPYIGINAQEVQLNELIENQHTLSTALSFDMPTQQSLQGEIGINMDYTINDKTSLLAGLGYQHEFKDNDKTIHTTVSSVHEYNQSFATPVKFRKQNATSAHLGATLTLGKTRLNAGIHASHQDGDTNVGGFVGAQMAF